VSPVLLQRQAALAAGALLATLGVLALSNRSDGGAPAAAVAPTIRWQNAVVGLLPAAAYERKTACGVRLDSGTIGVAHPLLPCGVDLVVALVGKEVRTEVIERAPVESGRDFDVTQALADELGLRDAQEIRWRFAG
jgi:hypothetical protein